MENVKYIFSDIDGTINLEADKTTIKTKDLEAIKTWQRKERHFVLTTGNRLEFVQKYQKQIFFNEYGRYAITNTGAQIYDFISNKVIFEKHLDDDVYKALVEYGIKNKFWIMITSSDDMYVPISFVKKVIGNLTKKYKKYGPKISGFKTYKDLKRAKDTIFKIDMGPIVDKNILAQEMERHYNFLSNEFKNIEINIQEKISLQITMSGISKGSTLKKLCEMNKWNIKNAVAVGDGENDISMLDIVGNPVTLENASDNVKKHAKYVTSSDKENGVSKLIEKLLIQQ